MPRGGKRAGAGRPKSNHDIPKSLALKVLEGIGDLRIKGVADQVGYALQLLKSKDERIRKEVFVHMLDRAYGKPPQAEQPVQEIKPGEGFKVTVEYIGRSNPPATEAS
jgi:hypothetical protein